MPSAWVFQKKEDVAKLGDKAPHYVGWYEQGRQKKKKVGSKSLANRFKQKVERDLIEGVVTPKRTSWSDFREEFRTLQRNHCRPSTVGATEICLNHFARLMGEVPVHEIDKPQIDEFVSRRLGEGKSKATVNKDLRALRIFLRESKARNYRRDCPEFRMLSEDEKDPTYVDSATFAKLYENCGAATTPDPDPGVWWQCYLTFLYMTGWRCMEPLSVPRSDFDETTGVVRLQAKNSKNHKVATLKLHPVVVDHLMRLDSSTEMLLEWPHGRRRLWDELGRIQQSAGVIRKDGRRYGFHDFRRGFASLNASRMTADSLQAVMRHADYSTTRKYISLAEQLEPAVANIYVPSFLAGKGGDR